MSVADVPANTESPATPEAPRSDRALMREEREIARKYLGRVPWEMVAWGLGNFVLWVSLFPLVIHGVMPLWLGFVIATVCCTLAYLPSHEAQHSIISTEGSKLRWLNELVGHVSLIPLVFPYRIAWITHRQHHAHANDPELDPDYPVHADTWYRSVWNSFRTRQGGNEAYAACLRRSNDPTVGRAAAEGAVLNLFYYAVLTGMAWSGHALEAAFLWWLPRHIGFSYILVFLSWAPHFPFTGTGRYTDTRAWKSPIGTVLSLGMEYHVVHHLFPKIPLLQTGPAYWELRDLLAKRGLRIDGL
jgi:beta-carotene hydroxylase